MNLIPTQLSTLKSWVIANHNSVFDQSTVDALNATSSPDYFVFKDKLALSEVMSNGFDWTVVDNLNVGPARIWEWMLRLSNEVGYVSPWKTTILKGVGEAFKGNTPAGKDAHRRNILRSHFPRTCRVWEKLYIAAAVDWNVGTNNDKTGNRGTNTNPDVMELDDNGTYLSGLMTLTIVELAESAA